MKISDLKDYQVLSGEMLSGQQNNVAPQLPQKQTTGVKSFGDTFVNPVVETGKGALKGAGSTLFGLGKIGTAVVRTLLPKSLEPQKTIYEEPKPEILTPKGGYQKLGYTAEQIGEFFVPATKAAKAEKMIDLISHGLTSPVTASATRILGKAAVQGVSAGAVRAAQTGGDIEETAKTAVVAGGVRAGMAIIGEGARALHIPERMYSMIFKNSRKDMLTELKSGGLESLRTKNPERFMELVDSGIIKVNNKGESILNDTLAESALNRGLKGSIRNMADEVVSKTLDTEDEVVKIAKNYKGTVNLPEKQYVNVLREIADEWKNVGFDEISTQATKFADTLEGFKGEVNAETALGIRRFLDKMRVASSYEKPITKLSLTQSNLKTLADAVRSKVNSIPGMSSKMQDYSFYIDALEALAKEASRRGNAQVISLIDSIFLGSSVVSPLPGATMGVLRRILMSPSGATYLGQLLKNSNISPLLSGGISAGSSSVLPTENQ